MLVTEDGIATLVNELHPQKAKILMLVTKDRIATPVNELHLKKARSPMMVTEDGIAIPVNELHPSKAQFLMMITEDGMVTVFTVVMYTPHSLHDPFSIVMVPSGILKCPSALTTDIFAAFSASQYDAS